jgi:heat shock protein HtpX
MRTTVARNIGKAWLLVALLAGGFAGLGWLVGDAHGATVFGFCSLLAAVGAYGLCDRVILGSLGATKLPLAENPMLASTVDRISAQLGMRSPSLSVIRDGFPRCFVVGRGPGSATLAISTGLIGALSPSEVEAVIAHELAHIRQRDVLVQSFAVFLASLILEVARIGGWFSRGLLTILAPFASTFTHLLLSPKREFEADLLASSVTDPLDLADALLRLDAASDLVSFTASPATEPLYTVSPFDASDRLTRMFVTHPPVEERVARLRALP